MPAVWYAPHSALIRTSVGEIVRGRARPTHGAHQGAEREDQAAQTGAQLVVYSASHITNEPLRTLRPMKKSSKKDPLT